MKSKLARITITIPEDLLTEAEAKLGEDEESRSALIRRLVEQALKQEQERRDVEQWIRAYQEQPVTEEETGWMSEIAVQSLHDVPWDDKG
jgi:metal-responsive CopG/Arc/MetJ family transcriptional regulator